MAHIDDLLSRVADESLREELRRAVGELRRRKKFGLVFEEHIPEVTLLPGAGVTQGSTVLLRKTTDETRYTVESVRKGVARVHANGSDPIQVPVADLLVVKSFGEPVYPVLTPIETLPRAPGRPYHAVINGENFHALQLGLFGLEEQIDVVYIDPPYNSGARDWKYNNRYVDATDAWRHSKWLSFMEKRLRLAKRLLKPDGVMVVTIDENEVSHLGVLLEELFPAHLRYMITSVINPKGTYKQNFGRVDEHLLFVVPNTGSDIIEPRPRTAEDGDEEEDNADRLIRRLLELGHLDAETVLATGGLQLDERACLEHALEGRADEDDEAPDPPDAEESDASADRSMYEYWFLRRRGQQSSYRTQRPNQFYAILVNERAREVVGIGPPLAKDDPWKVERDGDVVTVYPVDGEGNERVWRYRRTTMKSYIDAGEIVVGRQNPETGVWTLNHRKLRRDALRHKTVWWFKSHDAGVHGTNVVNRLLGKRNAFPFPKSLYAVRDTLATVVRSRPDALVMDFFAGSGTTLHATCLLHAQDGGRRRCILVTNNEVSEREAAALHARGLFRGDAEFEAAGIFDAATRPRVTAAVTGRRPDGSPVPGAYVGGRPYVDGFEENVAFFRLEYADPDTLALGYAFAAIIPALWLTAGSKGDPTDLGHPEASMFFPVGAPFAVLLNEDDFRSFLSRLEQRRDITHVWLVTDSEGAFARMREQVPGNRTVGMLYRDYLRNFRINAEVAR